MLVPVQLLFCGFFVENDPWKPLLHLNFKNTSVKKEITEMFHIGVEKGKEDFKV